MNKSQVVLRAEVCKYAQINRSNYETHYNETSDPSSHSAPTFEECLNLLRSPYAWFDEFFMKITADYLQQPIAIYNTNFIDCKPWILNEEADEHRTLNIIFDPAAQHYGSLKQIFSSNHQLNLHVRPKDMTPEQLKEHKRILAKRRKEKKSCHDPQHPS